MKTPPPPGTPRWPALLRAQLRATGLGLRTELTVVGLLLLLVPALDGISPTGFDFDLTEVNQPFLVLGLFAPLAVWKGEDPSRRSYFWTLPVDRSAHTLLRVFCGWGWLAALIGAYMLWAVGIARLTGGEIGSDRVRPLLEQAAPGTRLFDLTPGWMWLVPFAVATIAYLMGSFVALVSDHPWRWLAGACLGFLVLVQVAESIRSPELMGALNSVVAGRYGLNTLVNGSARQGLPHDLAAAWAGAATLWMVLGISAVLLAAFRRQER